jgi:uncharacterized protein (TIGR03086 family)
MTGFEAHPAPMTNELTAESCAPTPLDVRAVFMRAVDTGTEVIAGVGPDQLDRPTPCEQYNVRDLLGHLVIVLGRVAGIGRGEDPMAMPFVPPTVADDGWGTAWRAAAHEVQAAWADDDALARTVVLPWHQGPGAEILAGYVNEITVHQWDLATATGQSPDWDPTVVQVAFDAIREILPAEGRAERFAAIVQHMPAEFRDKPAPFAPAVTAPTGAPLIDQLVAWNGRSSLTPASN